LGLLNNLLFFIWELIKDGLILAWRTAISSVVCVARPFESKRAADEINIDFYLAGARLCAGLLLVL